MDPHEADRVELETREKFRGATYDADAVCQKVPDEPKDYFDVLLRIKIDLAKENAHGGTVLDLCCGSGEHLLALVHRFTSGFGVDFSGPLIARANAAKAAAGVSNVTFLEGNARQLPFPEGFFDLVYSFSSLYYVPRVDEVVHEISRTMKPGAKCVLDFGNRYSLNTIVCRAYPEFAHPCHISVPAMRRVLRDAGLTIEMHTAFQILPMWGDKPRWLRPLLRPRWARILGKHMCSRMLDEWVSNMVVFKMLAFRHIFVCAKNKCANGKGVPHAE